MMVEQCCKVEQRGGTVLVEQGCWNSGTVMVEQ